MELPLVEPAVVPEVHVDGIASIDRVGDNLKIAYYTIQRSLVGGRLERVICLRVSLSASMAQALGIIWNQEAVEGVTLLPRH